MSIKTIDNYKYLRQQLDDKYFHILLNEVQTWINANPDYKIYAGMGVWFLDYKGYKVYEYQSTTKQMEYIDNDHCRVVIVGLYDKFNPIAEMIDSFEAEGIYLGQNVEPQKGGVK